MHALAAALLSALSGAALRLIARLLTADLFEDLLVKLVSAGARKLAEKTESA